MNLQSPIRLSSITLITAALLFSACAPSVQYDQPKEWILPGGMDAVIELYRPSLTGRTIFLDPGHGGEDRFSHGPAELAVEADVNLAVALNLRSFLRRAGATVILSRDKDSTVTLRDRPRLAVAAGAEIFISLHHNDTGTRDNITNYSSVYYHSTQGRPDYFPANHDLARYIERDMAYAMRNPAPAYSPTFDGTLSDFDIYPNAGFAVLRGNPLPAVLIEGSFFSHPREEQRLAQSEYNEIEAWGIFIGVGKYFRAGIPELRLLSDTIQVTPHPTLKILAGPRGEIDPASISAWIDSLIAPVSLLDSVGTISVDPPTDLTSGVHQLRVELRNQRGNFSWPFTPRIKAMLPVAALATTAVPPAIPPDGRATSRISCRAFDRQKRPVADGTGIHFSVGGSIADTLALTSAGRAALDIHPTSSSDVLEVHTSGDGIRDSVIVPVRATRGYSYLDGIVRSLTDSLPVADAILRYALPGRSDSLVALADGDTDGRFFAYLPLPDSVTLVAGGAGYLSRQFPVDLITHFASCDILLPPVADGALFGDLLLLDPRFGGTERGDVSGTLRSSDVNLRIAVRLQTLLRAAGGRAVLVRDRDTTLSEHTRALVSGRYGRGFYVRIDASGRAGQSSCEIYSNAANQALAGSILKWIHIVSGLDSTATLPGETSFYREVAQSTLTAIIPSVATGYFDSTPDECMDAIAWGMFLGILENAGCTSLHRQRFRIADQATGSPLGRSLIVGGGVLSRYSDMQGIVDFYGLLDSGTFVQAPGHPPIHILTVLP